MRGSRLRGRLGATLELEVRTDNLLMKEPFGIHGYVFEGMPSVVATLRDGRRGGRDETAGVYYLKDDPANMTDMIEGVRRQIEAGATRQDLQRLLPPCGPATPTRRAGVMGVRSEITGVLVARAALAHVPAMQGPLAPAARPNASAAPEPAKPAAAHALTREDLSPGWTR